jgi:hypothetical protein
MYMNTPLAPIDFAGQPFVWELTHYEESILANARMEGHTGASIRRFSSIDAVNVVRGVADKIKQGNLSEEDIIRRRDVDRLIREWHTDTVLAQFPPTEETDWRSPLMDQDLEDLSLMIFAMHHTEEDIRVAVKFIVMHPPYTEVSFSIYCSAMKSVTRWAPLTYGMSLDPDDRASRMQLAEGFRGNAGNGTDVADMLHKAIRGGGKTFDCGVAYSVNTIAGVVDYARVLVTRYKFNVQPPHVPRREIIDGQVTPHSQPQKSHSEVARTNMIGAKSGAAVNSTTQSRLQSNPQRMMAMVSRSQETTEVSPEVTAYGNDDSEASGPRNQDAAIGQLREGMEDIMTMLAQMSTSTPTVLTPRMSLPKQEPKFGGAWRPQQYGSEQGVPRTPAWITHDGPYKPHLRDIGLKWTAEQEARRPCMYCQDERHNASTCCKRYPELDEMRKTGYRGPPRRGAPTGPASATVPTRPPQAEGEVAAASGAATVIPAVRSVVENGVRSVVENGGGGVAQAAPTPPRS